VTGPSTVDDESGSAADRILWWIVLVGALAVLATALVGVVLAMVGAYSNGLALGAGVLGAAAAVVPVRRALPPVRGASTVATVAVIALTGSLFLHTVAHLGEHVFTTRDPGSYLSTARWLSDGGELHVDAGSPVFDGIDVAYGGPGVYEVEPGIIEFQFSHGPAVVMAVGHGLFGSTGLLAASAAVGWLALLAVYLALRSVTRHPWLAVGGTVGLGVSLPILYVTRSTYSEPFVLLVVVLGVGLLLAAGRRPSVGQLAMASVLLGSAPVFRIDAGLYVIGVLLIAVHLVLLGRPRRDVLVVLACPVVPFVVGSIDVRVFAGRYASDLATNLRRLDVAMVVLTIVAVAALVVHRRIRLPDRWVGLPHRWAAALGVSVAVVGGLAWQVRPAVAAFGGWEADSGIGSAVEALQRANGLEVSPTRSYSELSVASIGWYLGVGVVASALVGFGLVAARAASDVRSRFVPFAIVAVVAGPLYLWDTNITPDQLWASRRFVPFVLPLFVIAAVWALDLGLAHLPTRRARRVGLGIAVVFLALPAAAATWPIREANEQRGGLDAVERLCELAGEDAHVLDLTIGIFSMPTRAWCGATAASIAEPTEAEVRRFLDNAAAACVPAVVIAADAATIDSLPSVAALFTTFDVAEVPNDRLAERTLARAPSRYAPAPLSWFAGRVPALGC
jgi:hypothetical protein